MSNNAHDEAMQRTFGKRAYVDGITHIARELEWGWITLCHPHHVYKYSIMSDDSDAVTCLQCAGLLMLAEASMSI